MASASRIAAAPASFRPSALPAAAPGPAPAWGAGPAWPARSWGAAGRRRASQGVAKGDVRGRCHNFPTSNRATTPRRALSTDKELNDFLKSVEKRAFKRAVYAVRNDDAALDIVQEAMIKLADNYAERPPAEWPMLFQRILSNARAFNELATDLLESLVLEGKPLLQWVASALSHRGLG